MIKIEGTRFVDEHGRQLMLRGVNLDAKVPRIPDGSTHIRENLFHSGEISFADRPIPLAEADEHFSRLRNWGFNLLRFSATWEAVEHAGPGIYDEQYLDYLYKIACKAGEHGLFMFIDPHQDVWSRFSGGGGAPAWTFDAAGMDIRKFKATGAAITQQAYGDEFIPQIWATNGFKLAAETMFTLFFAGNDFAPRTSVNGEPVQDYLQRHYIGAMQQVASRLKGLPAVLGYDTMNEPLKGYIGCEDLNSTAWHAYRSGDTPTAFQGMLLASGIPQKVEVWRSFPPVLTGKKVLNRQRERVWKKGFECVWKANGVWDYDGKGQPVLLRPQHFSVLNGRKVNFISDYMRPFYNRYASAIREADPDAIIFLTPPNGEYNIQPWDDSDAGNVVYKPHWYDEINWISKSYLPWLHPFVGRDKLTGRIIVGSPSIIQKSYNDQMRRLKEYGGKMGSGVPTLIGETGICYDLNGKRAYTTGDFSAQEKVMNRILTALEANQLCFTLWTYNIFNDNKYGDHWNMEDFSIFSRDQQTDPADPCSGGRALKAVIRPYPVAAAGEIIRLSFDMKSRVFEAEFRQKKGVNLSTEIFVPDLHYPAGYQVAVSDGAYECDAAGQRLIYRPDPALEIHSIRITPLEKKRL